MNYKLAKELKDAGFPQHYNLIPAEADFGSRDWLYQPHVVMDFDKPRPAYTFTLAYLDSDEGKELTVYRPTLSELIEACGEELSRLWRVDESYDNGKTKWCATGTNDFLDGLGTTPEEAVARLWLDLNRKEQ